MIISFVNKRQNGLHLSTGLYTYTISWYIGIYKSYPQYSHPLLLLLSFYL